MGTTGSILFLPRNVVHNKVATKLVSIDSKVSVKKSNFPDPRLELLLTLLQDVPWLMNGLKLSKKLRGPDFRILIWEALWLIATMDLRDLDGCCKDIRIFLCSWHWPYCDASNCYSQHDHHSSFWCQAEFPWLGSLLHNVFFENDESLCWKTYHPARNLSIERDTFYGLNNNTTSHK